MTKSKLQREPSVFPIASDTRFTTVHPRTALWWMQRGKCIGCKHSRTAMPPSVAEGRMSCVLTPMRGKGRADCIDAREVGADCGPDAILFSPRK